ncbi:hypothetical protein FNV43_RR06174 [Rhamnella rubrinervis]|uniref:S-adenosylmethionine-dependent methyltransferase n=1 Tax=Rhamnella rubrinervis TaxID=2594499 RepID=A0A8K0ML56_9ROSA|nr:hypothetical protein FNV43_RR06174 [Rhamnella rubrinervis]
MELSEAYPMTGGDGLHSYAKNSDFQRKAIDVAKQLISKAIAQGLDVGDFNSTKSLGIADLGCSVGPNTFTAVDNIIEAVKSKYESQIPEFHVFFNDHVSNDFNLLFTSLPQDKQYYAAGVPGSFYDHVFPDASLHIVHSSSSLHWLSGVPKEVTNNNSPAFNKGRITYANSGDEVIRAFKAQNRKDMDRFLHARALEVVPGGLVILVFPYNPDGTHPSRIPINMSFGLIGSALMDLAGKGIVGEDKVDSFNMPVYVMHRHEVEAAVERNGCFSVVSMEILPKVRENFSSNDSVVDEIVGRARSATEGIIKPHFGEDILDELFDVFRKKLAEDFVPSAKTVDQEHLFLALKRKP